MPARFLVEEPSTQTGRRVRKALVKTNLSVMAFLLFARNDSDPIGRIFVKIDIGEFY
jgi:hypothetical protein